MAKRRFTSFKFSSVLHQITTFIHHPQETLILCVVSALDVAMTIKLLTRKDISFRFTESNPFARYFMDRWGLEGMAYFKATMTIFVCVLMQVIARKNSELARQVLELATVIVVAVVIYSAWLHFNHRQIVEVHEARMHTISRSFFKSII